MFDKLFVAHLALFRSCSRVSSSEMCVFISLLDLVYTFSKFRLLNLESEIVRGRVDFTEVLSLGCFKVNLYDAAGFIAWVSMSD